MEIKDLSWNEFSSKRKNNGLLPRSIRGLIIGSSGSGKSTLMNNLLIQPGWLDYDNLFIFGKSLFQSEYKILKKAFEEKIPKKYIVELYELRDEAIKNGLSPEQLLDEMSKRIAEKSDIDCKFYETAGDVPDPRDLSKEKKNLMIFDDLQLEKQNKCESYYVRGRHSNVDCCYLAQNYFKLPRQTIRENSNFICLFPQNAKNINHLYEDHVSMDMPKDEFKGLCKQAWKKPHGFVVIDLTSNKYGGKYRSGLDEFYIPEMAEA